MRTAIIVDPDPIVRTHLTGILRKRGFAIVGEGQDGFDAVDLCRTHNPDLLLTEIKLPIFSGLDSTRTVTSEYNAPHF